MSIDNLLKKNILTVGLVVILGGCNENKEVQFEEKGGIVYMKTPASDVPNISSNGQNSSPLFLETQKKAEAGDVNAQYNLGMLYYKGEGVSKDKEKAFRWFEKSAEQGNAEAQYSVGLMYAIGEGVSKNTRKKIEWYQKAAIQGHSLAQYRLAETYTYGQGVPKDLVLAYAWYSIGATHDDDLTKIAQSERDKCELEMSPEEIAKAKKFVSQLNVKETPTKRWAPTFYERANEATPCTLMYSERNPWDQKVEKHRLPNLKVELGTSLANFIETTNGEQYPLTSIRLIEPLDNSLYIVGTFEATIHDVALRDFHFVGWYGDSGRTLPWTNIDGVLRVECNH